MKREKRKAYITRERRQQILDAAYGVFISKGFARATTAEIARTAGIAEGTIYNYFGSKRDLFTELIKSHLLSEPLVEMIKRPFELNILSLSTLIENRLGVFFDNADLLLLLLGEMQRDADLHQQFIDTVTAPGINMLKGFLESMMEKGVVRQCNSGMVARILPAIMIGLTMLRVVEGKGGLLDTISRKEMVTELVNFNTRALFATDIR